MTSDERLQSRVTVTRERTKRAYADLAKVKGAPISTPLLELFNVLVERIVDLEEDLGYIEESSAPVSSNRIDTQGR